MTLLEYSALESNTLYVNLSVSTTDLYELRLYFLTTKDPFVSLNAISASVPIIPVPLGLIPHETQPSGEAKGAVKVIESVVFVALYAQSNDALREGRWLQPPVTLGPEGYEQ